MILDLLKTAISWAYSAFGERRRVRLTVHRACFVGGTREYYFINATNLSHHRDIEVTHIWFGCEPQIDVLQAERPLPVRLKPDQTWETWIEVDSLPAAVREDPYKLGRARLSTGRVFESRRNEGVPKIGYVPGGPVEPHRSRQ